MPKNVVFHIGLPKTGTTTLQKYLRSQEGKLRSLGFMYPALEHQVMHAHKQSWMFNAVTGKAIVPSEGLSLEACRTLVGRAFEAFAASDLETLIWSDERLAMSAGAWDGPYLARLLDGADVRIVFFARYTDAWIDSLYKELIWARGGARAEAFYAEPLPPIAAPPGAAGATTQPDKGPLRNASRMPGALRTIRRILPSAEIVVCSYDANREAGKVVSGAMAAMGLLLEDAFPEADEEAGLRNPTKSDVHSMLLYHLLMARAGVDVLREVATACRRRENKGRRFEPLTGRRFRFLSDEDTLRARGYYEDLRQEYPDLPAQPPYVSSPGEKSLPRDDAVALLDWLRPNISDAIFDKACAAYPPI